MAISNREKQKRYRESRRQTGDSRIGCWLTQDDNQRLQRLIDMMNENGHDNAGYSAVISLALKELEISLTPAGSRNVIRYGLKYMS